ncbi:MAG: YbaB/EbfC family nucleoid-associated protein [Proteobacteria bacterium]|nr:YbaB/EbfC family nucleoid-associated protein [Pseudomonadota bacterium]MBU1640992.1 YbaB/EbfC family nucleoid-associated protein [Pseudomonadota bacterium]
MDMNAIMQQAQQFQHKMTEMQAELADKTVSASVGGGMVTAVVNGRHEVVSITIEKEVITPDDPGMLQDLVAAAVNAAMKQAKEMIQTEMAKLTGGLGIDIPNMFG